VAKVTELLSAGRTYSFEFFPPKTDAELMTLVQALRDLQPLRPSFVSVTYRGGPASRQRTTDLVRSMLRRTSLTPMAHLTCAGHTRLELADILVTFRKSGVENLMALGGDPLPDPAPPSELSYALELVELARAIGGFCIGVAAHPDGNVRSPNLASDRQFLARKLGSADFAITQFFFTVDDYLRLVDDLAKHGVDKPVIPGVMPVTSIKQVPRMAQMGSPVPQPLVEAMEAAAAGGQDTAEIGTDAATELCTQLLDHGAPGLHFYTLNRSAATRQIYANLGLTPAPA
jgi:methylenetetrahydrofolate reductase (NADPH)